MRAIEFHDGVVHFLDQNKLPGEELRVETSDYRTIAHAIRTLSLRGAPLIGIAAAYGVVLAARAASRNTLADFVKEVRKSIDLLAAARPTAVNLVWALERQRSVLGEYGDLNENEIVAHLAAEAMTIHREDEEMCEQIAEFGCALLPLAANVLTHCNTGALATGGRGTALGIITKMWETGRLRKVFVDETRPLLQGSRLTAWELDRAGIPFEIITDSAAAFVMQRGQVNVVLVGADRIAANGDVANKIGTYNLAVLAHYHGMPFYVAAPSSTIDLNTPSGKEIPIEQREHAEMVEWHGTHLAPAGAQCYNPAFDITPASRVTAFVTESGVLRPPYAASLRAAPRERKAV